MPGTLIYDPVRFHRPHIEHAVKSKNAILLPQVAISKTRGHNKIPRFLEGFWWGHIVEVVGTALANVTPFFLYHDSSIH